MRCSAPETCILSNGITWNATNDWVLKSYYFHLMSNMAHWKTPDWMASRKQMTSLGALEGNLCGLVSSRFRFRNLPIKSYVNNSMHRTAPWRVLTVQDICVGVFAPFRSDLRKASVREVCFPAFNKVPIEPSQHLLHLFYYKIMLPRCRAVMSLKQCCVAGFHPISVKRCCVLWTPECR